MDKNPSNSTLIEKKTATVSYLPSQYKLNILTYGLVIIYDQGWAEPNEILQEIFSRPTQIFSIPPSTFDSQPPPP